MVSGPWLKAAEDYDVYLKISRRFPVACVNRPMVEYRQHRKSMSTDPARMLSYTHNVLLLQWAHTRRSRSMRRAYRDGKKVWQQYYGELLIDAVVGHLSKGEWHDGLRGLGVLLVHFPAGCASALLRTVTPRTEFPFLRRRILRRTSKLNVGIGGDELRRWIRCVVTMLPPGTKVAVASPDRNLSTFERHEGTHFPQKSVGSQPQIFATGPSGSQTAPWIGDHGEYMFALYKGEEQIPAANITVRGDRDLPSAQARHPEIWICRGRGARVSRPSPTLFPLRNGSVRR